MAENINKANFFIVGAAKAGTTSIYHYLNEHPDVYVSPIKEPNFFSTDIDTSKFTATFRNNLFTDLSSYFSHKKLKTIQQAFVRDEDQYNRLFEDATGKKVICECSTSYLPSTCAAKSIHEYNPDSKILIILREPIDRLYSHYLMALRFGFTSLPFREALEKDIAQSEKGIGVSEMFLELSSYTNQVQRYLDTFTNKQVKIMFFENLKSDPKSFISEVMKFLEIEPITVQDTSIRNEASLPKFIRLNRVLTKTGVKKRVMGILPKGIKNSLKKVLMKTESLDNMSRGDYKYATALLENETAQFKKELKGIKPPW